MAMIDLIPQLDLQALTNLHANALRLEQGTGPQRSQAEIMLPLIEKELAERKAREPVKVTKPRAKKASTKKIVETVPSEDDSADEEPDEVAEITG